MLQNVAQKYIWRLILVFLLGLIAACEDTDNTATPAEPTPVAWRVSTAAINQTTAPRIALVGRLDGHGSTVFQMSFSSDSRYLATVSAGDQRVNIWDTTSGENIGGVGTLEPIWAFFDPSAEYFYIIDRKRTISQWSMQNGNQVATLPVQRETDLIGSITFGNGGNWVATSGERGMVYIVSLNPFEPIAEINAHPVVPVTSIALSDSGKYLVSLGADNVVRIWDIATNDMLLELKDFNNPKQVLFSPNDEQLAIFTETVIYLYDTADWSRQASMIVPNGAVGSEAQYSNDGSKLITYGDDLSVYIWNLETQALWVELPNHRRGVKRALLSQDQSMMITLSGAEDVFLWDLTPVTGVNSREVELRRANLPLPNNINVHDLWWSPDERFLAVADFVGRVFIFGIP